MRSRSFAPLAVAPLLVLAAWLVGCEQDPAPSELSDPDVDVTHEEIFGGVADSSNQYRAVVALYDSQGGFACSGTIIAKSGSTAYVLTAAHCTGMDLVMIAKDWGSCPNGSNCEAVFSVVGDVVHPQYHAGNGTGSDPPYNDFRILRINGAANVPVIPVATNPDGLAASGDTVRQVGFGVTQTNDNNTQRRYVDIVTAQVTSLYVANDQTNGKGTCSGDSGGPTIFNGKVVAVTSFGDPNCTSDGVSGRVQTAQAWIVQQTGTVTETCDTCFDSEVNQPAGQCYPQVDACLNDPACSNLVDCLSACGANDGACVDACANASTAAGIGKYTAIFDCWCVACASLCSAECGGTSSSSSSTGSGLSTSNAAGSGGGAGTGGAAGAGGASASGNTGSDGDATDGDTVQSCNCSTPGAPSDSPFGALGLAAAGLAMSALYRRRRG